MRKEALRIDNLTYVSGGMRMLDLFRLNVFEGEVMGVYFADGHGKDEFVKIIMENLELEFGKVYIADTLVNTHANPRPAKTPFASLISGEQTLIDEMSVAENVFVMRPYFRKFLIQPPVLKAQFERAAEKYGIELDGGMPAGKLHDAGRYAVALLKAAVSGRKIVLVKDLSNHLEENELLQFHQYLRRFASENMTFVYISDHPEELFRVCDRIAVSERGRVSRILERKDFKRQYFREWLFDPRLAGQLTEGGDSLLRFDHVSGGGLKNVDFSVAKGECVLFWDQHDRAIPDVVDYITGKTRPVRGEVRFEGRRIPQARPPVSVIRETPGKTMVFGQMSYIDNLCFHAARRFPFMWLFPAYRRSIRNEYYPLIGDAIDARDPWSVSPAALYDLVYYRERLFGPKLLVVVRPFLDTDAALKTHIVSLIDDLRARGTTILILDTNRTESSFLVDRTLVVQRGELVNEIRGENTDEYQASRAAE